jgi:hypothetical protein
VCIICIISPEFAPRDVPPPPKNSAAFIAFIAAITQPPVPQPLTPDRFPA